jgi:8-oxo-dGTP pyrophosphatase MutT (NUDIX family)
MAVSHPLAAGGIVVRHGTVPRIALVRLRKDKTWVLPKGKLNRGEPAHAAAEREVLEETGHQVTLHEFVGAMTYPVRGRPKVVRFWRMEAGGRATRKLMRDVVAVEFLSFNAAVRRLSRSHERLFLEKVWPCLISAIVRQERKRVANMLGPLLFKPEPALKVKPKPKRARKKLKSGRRSNDGTIAMTTIETTQAAGSGRAPWPRLQRYVLDRLRTGRDLLRG